MNKEKYKIAEIINSDVGFAKSETPEKKMQFLAMASLYEQDFLKNITLDSLELSTKYPEITPAEWLDFLVFPPIKKYLDGFLNERAEKQAMKALGEGNLKASDALKIKADIDNKKERVDNSNIVIFFLPQKDYGF
jgi:hypothetical protein